jgi:hypothetical protein
MVGAIAAFAMPTKVVGHRRGSKALLNKAVGLAAERVGAAYRYHIGMLSFLLNVCHNLYFVLNVLLMQR